MSNIKSHKATVSLFNAIQVSSRDTGVEFSRSSLQKTIPYGFVLDPRISPHKDIIKLIKKIVGISGVQANSAFHKSWKIIESTPQETLWLQAIMHYMTTYGVESITGQVADSKYVYIPAEELNLPNITENIPLVYIKAVSYQDMLKNVIKLGNSGMALHTNTVGHLFNIIKENKYDEHIVNDISNRELLTKLYDFYELTPTEPNAWLRYVVNKLTGQSLFIKNAETLELISVSDVRLLDKYIKSAPDDLGSIFLRNKKIFLAMKKISSNKTFFNRLRKNAKYMHKPMEPDYLNSVTSMIKNGTIDYVKLENKLESASIFRKIRLAYALSFRDNNSKSIVYRVRNGKAWASKFRWNNDVSIANEITLQSIISSLEKNVKGKVIYVPSGINYAMPATEKQFTGNIPTGTSVEVNSDLVCGIHWENQERRRIDLDLSINSLDVKIGWDSNYRSHSNNILFSGDLTDAPLPNGAAELFYIKNNIYGAYTLDVNYYNYQADINVPTKLFIAQENISNLSRNYMVNVNNIIANAMIDVCKPQNTLALLIGTGTSTKFYFANINIGASITSRTSETSEHVREYLINKFMNSISLNDIFELSGATIVNDRPTDCEYIDLAPEALDKTTIIDLLI